MKTAVGTLTGPATRFAAMCLAVTCVIQTGDASPQTVVWSDGFETGPGAWAKLRIRSSEYDAPVEGVS